MTEKAQFLRTKTPFPAEKCISATKKAKKTLILDGNRLETFTELDITFFKIFVKNQLPLALENEYFLSEIDIILVYGVGNRLSESEMEFKWALWRYCRS